MDVQITNRPPLRVAAVHHVGPYQAIGGAFARLGDIAGKAGLFGRAGSQMIGVYHDDPRSVAAEQLQSDAGVTLAKDMTLPAGLDEVHVDGGKYAMTTHIGPYEQLPDTWGRLMGEWLPASGHRTRAGASYEIYLNDPSSTPKELLETEIYVPIEK
jgi:AraC family transcriptional regulator